MWESRSDFQGRWVEWKTCFWFSRLSRDRHFHGSAVVSAFGSLLLFLRRSAEAIGFRARFQDVSAIGDSIQQRFAEPRVGDHLRPFGKRQVCGQYHGGLLGSLGHNLKQELGADLGQRHLSDLVDGDQVVATPARHHAPKL